MRVTHVASYVLLLFEAEYLVNIFFHVVSSAHVSLLMYYSYAKSCFFTNYLGRSAVNLLLKLMRR